MPAPLTPRQEECLRLTRLMTDREIASKLGISEPTVKKHVMEACQRLGVNRRKLALGLLEASDVGTRSDIQVDAIGPDSSEAGTSVSARAPRLGYRPPPRDPFARAVMIAVTTVVCAVMVGALTNLIARQQHQVRSIEVAIGTIDPAPARAGGAA